MPEQYKQEPLFDLDGVKEGEQFGQRHYWYYITDARNEKMIFGISPDGSPMWCEHDTRPNVGVQPYLFNNRCSATRYKNDHEIKGTVRKWLYSYK